VKDLALILERQWDIRVPNVHGAVPRPPPPYVRPPVRAKSTPYMLSLSLPPPKHFLFPFTLALLVCL